MKNEIMTDGSVFTVVGIICLDEAKRVCPSQCSSGRDCPKDAAVRSN
jgi:hypothetical protein